MLEANGMECFILSRIKSAELVEKQKLLYYPIYMYIHAMPISGLIHFKEFSKFILKLIFRCKACVLMCSVLIWGS